MTRKTAELSIVFADISGSTRLYETLGDNVARALVAQCLTLMTDHIEKHQGTVIKTIGDEIMCTFPSADAAVEASVAMQEAVTDNLPALNPGSTTSVAIRIGLHHGPAILEHGDVFGDAVNTAARMAGVAKGGQIITTQETAEMLSALLRGNTRHLDRIAVKGKSGTTDIFEVIWQPDDVTRIATCILRTEAKAVSLLLRYHEKELRVDPDTGTIILGRGNKADMVVNDTMASREHARIEWRRDKFVLADQSTNGTYVLTSEGPAYLRREETTLTGEGKISFGRKLTEAEEIVTFCCEA